MAGKMYGATSDEEAPLLATANKHNFMKTALFIKIKGKLVYLQLLFGILSFGLSFASCFNRNPRELGSRHTNSTSINATGDPLGLLECSNKSNENCRIMLSSLMIGISVLILFNAIAGIASYMRSQSHCLNLISFFLGTLAVISCLAGIILCTYATFYEGSLAPSNHALVWFIAASEACFYIQSILSMASALTSWLLMSSRSCFCSCLCMGVECICGGVDKPSGEFDDGQSIIGESNDEVERHDETSSENAVIHDGVQISAQNRKNSEESIETWNQKDSENMNGYDDMYVQNMNCFSETAPSQRRKDCSSSISEPVYTTMTDKKPSSPKQRGDSWSVGSRHNVQIHKNGPTSISGSILEPCSGYDDDQQKHTYINTKDVRPRYYPPLLQKRRQSHQQANNNYEEVKVRPNTSKVDIHDSLDSNQEDQCMI